MDLRSVPQHAKGFLLSSMQGGEFLWHAGGMYLKSGENTNECQHYYNCSPYRGGKNAQASRV